MVVSIEVGFDTRIPNTDVWWFKKPYSLHIRFIWFFIDMFFSFDKYFRGEK